MGGVEAATFQEEKADLGVATIAIKGRGEEADSASPSAYHQEGEAAGFLASTRVVGRDALHLETDSHALRSKAEALLLLLLAAGQEDTQIIAGSRGTSRSSRFGFLPGFWLVLK